MNKIYSVHYNRPDFVELQYFSLKNHLKNDFELTVINNSKDEILRKQINDKCNELKINIFETNSIAELVGDHHSEALNKCWQTKCINDNDYVWIMDGDVFLIQDLEIKNFMKDHPLCGPRQTRKQYNYLTPCIVIFDMKKIINPNEIYWNGICVDGTHLDTGGATYYYLNKYKNIKTQSKDLKSSWHIRTENNNLHCLPEEVKNDYNEEYYIEFFGNEFLHYRASSNWDYKSNDYHINKTNFIKKIIYGSVDKSVTIKNHNYQMNNSEYFGWVFE